MYNIGDKLKRHTDGKICFVIAVTGKMVAVSRPETTILFKGGGEWLSQDEVKFYYSLVK